MFPTVFAGGGSASSASDDVQPPDGDNKMKNLRKQLEEENLMLEIAQTQAKRQEIEKLHGLRGSGVSAAPQLPSRDDAIESAAEARGGAGKLYHLGPVEREMGEQPDGEWQRRQRAVELKERELQQKERELDLRGSEQAMKAKTRGALQCQVIPNQTYNLQL